MIKHLGLRIDAGNLLWSAIGQQAVHDLDQCLQSSTAVDVLGKADRIWFSSDGLLVLAENFSRGIYSGHT